MYSMLQDIRFAARQLRKNPAFALTTVVTLAVGIGATTAIFSLVNTVLLRPLPVPVPERLASLQLAAPGPGSTPLPSSVSYPTSSIGGSRIVPSVQLHRFATTA